MSRGRYYVGTLNNPQEDGETFVKKVSELSSFKYVCAQLEKGAEGTEHLQFYVEFGKPKRMSFLKNNLSSTAHFERRRGTAEEAREYCRKQETRVSGPWELGEWDPQKGGQRNDILEGCSLVQDGGISKLVSERPDLYVRYRTGFEGLHFRLLPSERESVEVVLLFGVPGCGKTLYVRNAVPHESLYMHEPGSRWFDGYESHPNFLLDDFCGSGSGFRLDYTLRLLDKYPLRLPVKGSFTSLLARRIFITTNIHPYCWFKWSGRRIQYSALCRRIGSVLVFDGFTPRTLDSSERGDFFNVPDGPLPGSCFGDCEVSLNLL